MIAYFDSFSGISGDMLIGALLDAGLDFEKFKREMTALDLPGVELRAEKVVKQNIAATKFDVIDKQQQAYRHLKDLNDIVDKTGFDDELKATANAIFLKLGVAEAKIHNMPLEKVHFHEVGAVDTIIDVVGALVALTLLNVDKVVCSQLNVGSGTVTFSHGTFPVPAPATAEILRDIPIYSSGCQAELVTPTGAAIISTLVSEFGELPNMRTERIGYGAGTSDLEHPNVLRVFVGEEMAQDALDSDEIAVLETNIDDMNPEIYDHLFDRLFTAGALDVFMTSVAMKKSRPGMVVTVLAEKRDENKIAELLFRETTTIGVRCRHERRKKLHREIQERDTAFGKVPFKISKLRDEVLNVMPEYDACKKIAKEQNIPLKQVYAQLAKEVD